MGPLMGHLRDNISGIVRKKRPIIQCYIQDNSMFHTAHETGEHKTSILPTLLLLLLCLCQMETLEMSYISF